MDNSGNRKPEQKPRLAASFYLNSAPLIWSFQHGALRDEVELLTDSAPARCADMLARGEVDAALMPVIEYQRQADLVLIPDVCVGSRERVRSVVLVTRAGRELSDVRSVALDLQSRTSAALVKIIFREFLGLEPEWKASAPHLAAMLETSDAALLIGDPAMTFPRAGLRVYDLAELWRMHTGRGFVFAMWMARRNAPFARGVDFATARDEGVAHIAEIAELYQTRLGLPTRELEAYLLNNIRYQIDAELGAGLELFYELADRHKLIPGLRELETLTTATS